MTYGFATEQRSLLTVLARKAALAKAQAAESAPVPAPAAPSAAPGDLAQLASLGAALVEATAAVPKVATLERECSELRAQVQTLTRAREAQKVARVAESVPSTGPTQVMITRDARRGGLAGSIVLDYPDEQRRLDIRRDRAGHIMALHEDGKPFAKIIRDAAGALAAVELA